jgi:hypothetical protein
MYVEMPEYIQDMEELLTELEMGREVDIERENEEDETVGDDTRIDVQERLDDFLLHVLEEVVIDELVEICEEQEQDLRLMFSGFLRNDWV